MGSFSVEKIRNICLMGHGGDGKTSLVESMLFLTNAIDRLGKVSDGNTTLDFDPEEIRRKFSISTSIAPIIFKEHKINVLDTPGFFDFAGEVSEALRAADAGLIVVTAKSGPEVGTEKAWKAVQTKKMPRMFYISKIDEDNADYYATLHKLQKLFDLTVCPIVVPIIENEKETGVVDCVIRKAYKMDGNKRIEVPIPDDMLERVNQHRVALCENVAELSEELMERYFAGEEFSDEELISGIGEAVRKLYLAPVFCGSAYTGIGTYAVLKGIVDCMPSPLSTPNETAEDLKTNEIIEINKSPQDLTSAIVFKTTTDQYGRFSFFKVISGTVTSDMTLYNPNTETTEKIGHIYSVCGKKMTEVKEITCGDIGAVSKLVKTKTGNTLCAPIRPLILDDIEFAPPVYERVITPKERGGEEKISSGLTKLADEDPSFKQYLNHETHQHILAGVGDMHLDVITSKLKSKFGVEVVLGEPIVAYREKIRKKVSVEGKHKKQSGGHGQYGHVKMDFEPSFDADFVFEEKIFGGSVPKNYHPAVEKGIREAMEHGVLAGYPVVGLKAILTDGSYHDVDSNELSFKMAAKLAYKAGISQANPVIMEPIGSMSVIVPDFYMGDVIGDINKRRGHILGMTPTADGLQEVICEVPMAETADYAIALRSMTQGRGTFSINFERYDEAPMPVQERVIANSPYRHVNED